ncbi:hypothetical protein [Streptomyces sp. Ru72]|uniref:hypothetical protein n=1 Tax=Streptomyces sp. Ru72 TaxID=2080747 RepID=UPI000CDE1D68|nr:hypothetical protein [Streptomyces sp. Ru72]POX53407.1 hypothetical protein C3488_05320 [Streptomyces sp. Ru72]
MRKRIAGGLGVVLAVGAAVPAAAAVAGPRVVLASHGHVTLSGGRADVRLTPRNDGWAAVAGATVRLHFSRALDGPQQLPEACAVADPSTVLCGTGPLAAGGAGREIRLRVGLEGAPGEVRLEVDTLREGDAGDRDPAGDRQRVLALDTGDDYAF